MCWVGNHPSTVWCREKMCRDMLLGMHCPVQCRISTTYILKTTGPSPELHPLAGPAFAEMFWHFLIIARFLLPVCKPGKTHAASFPADLGGWKQNKAPFMVTNPVQRQVLKACYCILGPRKPSHTALNINLEGIYLPSWNSCTLFCTFNNRKFEEK